MKSTNNSLIRKAQAGLLGLAFALGVGGSYATKVNHADAIAQPGTTVWYGVADDEDGNTWHWESAEPSGKSCSMASGGACRISTTDSGTPPANGFPANYTVLDGSSNRLYQ